MVSKQIGRAAPSHFFRSSVRAASLSDYSSLTKIGVDEAPSI